MPTTTRVALTPKSVAPPLLRVSHSSGSDVDADTTSWPGVVGTVGVDTRGPAVSTFSGERRAATVVVVVVVSSTRRTWLDSSPFTQSTNDGTSRAATAARAS